jgi:hypothetical protein
MHRLTRLIKRAADLALSGRRVFLSVYAVMYFQREKDFMTLLFIRILMHSWSLHTDLHNISLDETFMVLNSAVLIARFPFLSLMVAI